MEPGEQESGAIPVLDIGGMHPHHEEQPDRVDEDMALAAVDLFAPVIATTPLFPWS